MAYNHGKAEYKWKLWKEREEKILRDSGVTEDTIEAIRFYDRQAFNSDRRYYERVQETDTYLDTVAASTDQAEPKTVHETIPDSQYNLRNPVLFSVLPDLWMLLRYPNMYLFPARAHNSVCLN